MTQVYLIRHAPVVVDPNRPARDWPLAPGAEEALAPIIARLEGVGVSQIAASPEPKAGGTGGILARALSVPLQIRDGFEEHHRAQSDYCADPALFRQKIADLFARPQHVAFGSESAHQALRRFRAALERERQATDGPLVIVSHGTVISLIAEAHGHGAGFEIWRRLQMPDLLQITLP